MEEPSKEETVSSSKQQNQMSLLNIRSRRQALLGLEQGVKPTKLLRAEFGEKGRLPSA